MVNVEDWGETSFPWKKVILVILLVGAIVGTVVAVYKITSPDSDPVIVTTPATLTKPSVNATLAVSGDTIQITTTLSDSAEGLQVFFYENDLSIGSAYTNSAGQAIMNRVVNSPGTYIYLAEFMHP
jgi:hypothetical protein